MGVVPLLDPKEIDLEIAKWEYLESSYENYAKLADLYIIRDHMALPAEAAHAYEAECSAEPAPIVGHYGNSDFYEAISGKDPARVWSIMDDLMDTIHTVNPRVYDGVMRKIRSV